MQNQAATGEGLNLASLLCLGSKPALSRSSSHVESSSCRASFRGPAVSQGGFSSLCWTPGLGHPICDSNYSLSWADLLWCVFPFPLSSRPGAQISTSSLQFPSFPVLCGSLSQPWWYRSLSANFQLLFSENCSIGRCIFDVSMERGEFHKLFYNTILIQSPISFLNVCLWERFEN